MIDAIITAARALCAELDSDIFSDAPECEDAVDSVVEKQSELLRLIEQHEAEASP